jgi:threonine synthase
MSDHVTTASRISLGEGNTPLLRSRHIGPRAGLPNLYLKLETSNPTGSFKDRFAAAAISHMLAHGQTRCIATSSGNTGSALAAYCAAASIACHIAIVETAPPAKLRQMMAYGAHIFRIRQFGLDADVTDRAFAALRQFGSQAGSALQISSYTHSPAGMKGVEPLSSELHQQLAGAVDHVFCPAGGGGLCVSVARGFAWLNEQGERPVSPAVHCVQPAGNDTIAGPLRRGDERARNVDCTTRISGLQVASVVDGHLAIDACRASGGTGHLVTDEQVWQAQRLLARDEGIFCEPAGAAALAGALLAAADGTIRTDARVVCLVTGSGFKDEDSITRMLDGVDCPLIDLDQLSEVIDHEGRQ